MPTPCADLRFGADDFDVPWEDEVTEAAGALVERDVARVLNYAREEGFSLQYRHVAKNPRVPVFT